MPTRKHHTLLTTGGDDNEHEDGRDATYLNYRRNWLHDQQNTHFENQRTASGRNMRDGEGVSAASRPSRSAGTERLTSKHADQWLEDLRARAVGYPRSSEGSANFASETEQAPSVSGTGPKDSHSRAGGHPRSSEGSSAFAGHTEPSTTARTSLPRLGAEMNSPPQQQPKQHRSSQRSGPSRDKKIGPSAEQEEEQDLTEVAAPAPVANEDRDDSGKLEGHQRRRGGSTAEEEEQEDVTEVAARQPVPDENQNGQWHKQEHLEDAPQYDYQQQSDRDTPRVSNAVTQLYILGHLIFWSILGTLARLGTMWITFYPGAPIAFSNLWANFGGTLVMGFLAEDRKIFNEEWGVTPSPPSSPTKDPRGTESTRAKHMKAKKTIPLYIGLTVAFCGSYTSFSEFERDVFLALANRRPAPLYHPAEATSSPLSTIPRNGGYSFEALLAVIILTVTACIGALQFGAHCAIALDRFTPTIPFRLTRRFLDPLIVFLGIGCWIGAIVMAAVPPDRVGGPAYAGHGETWRGQVVFSLVFSPVGCLLRFYLSLHLNSLISWFPLGTFAANTFGTAVFGMAYALQRTPLAGSSVAAGSMISCQVLQGLQDGFCGTLTTVSTWIVELTTLRRRHGYLYGLASVVAGLALLVVIMGSVLWTIEFRNPICASEIN